MYGDSRALSSDSSPIFPSNFKEREEVALVKREKQCLHMESSEDTHYSEFGQQFGCNRNSQNSSGLLRFRSAPTSLLASFTIGGDMSEKMDSIFSSGEVNSVRVMSENDDSHCKKSRFTAMNSQLPPQYPRQSDAQMGYRVGSNQQGQGGIGSNLLRQNSSPAGLFSHLNSQAGYSGNRAIGRYRMGDGGGNGDLSPSSNRFKNQMDFPSGLPSSSLGMLSRINEVENENPGPMSLDEGKVGNNSVDSFFFSSESPFGSWSDSSYFPENFTSGIKRELEHDPQLFVNTERCEPGNRPNIVTHHLSLPKTSTELVAVEKLMHLQDTVPCKVRAKRGCATHPRSIAERVRRTKISERMRKLQELVPNMDKQTNTADMLDLVVQYIKDLQKQHKTLSDDRANCKCSAFEKVGSEQTH